MTSPAFALYPFTKSQFFNNDGTPLTGGKINTYVAGSLLPSPTYTDYTGNTPNDNPVTLDAAGRCDMWLAVGQGYKFVATDADNNPIWTEDNISVGSSGGASGVSSIIAGTGVTISPTDGIGDVTVNASGGGGSNPTFIIQLSTDLGPPLGDGPLQNGDNGTWTNYYVLQSATGYTWDVGNSWITLPDTSSWYQVTMANEIYEDSGESFDWLGSHGSLYGQYVDEAYTNGSTFGIGPMGADGNIIEPTYLGWTSVDFVQASPNTATVSPFVWFYSANSGGNATTMGLQFNAIISVTKITP